jgi:hypothetical protein
MALHIAERSVFEVVTLDKIFRRKKVFSEEQKLNGLINFLHGKRAKVWV